ncbi:MAG: methyltransferase [Rhodospirillales bacterium]
MEETAISQDALLDGRVRLLQPVAGYRVAIDAVILAAAIEAEANETILDVGMGAGAASLCLAARVPGCRVVGVEVQRELAALASRNVQLNGMEARVETIVADVAKRMPPRLAPGTFHHVMTNPPHLAPDSATAPRDPSKSIANVESSADLGAWLNFCLIMLRSKGSLTVIHRADRLGEILALLKGKAGEIVIFPLWPGEGKAAKRVLVRARKSVATPLALAPGLVLHEDNGDYTVAAEEVLRHAAALYI